MERVTLGLLAGSVALGYFTIAVVIAPRIKMPSAGDRFVRVVRIAAVAFFLGCGMTHVHIVGHSLGLGAPRAVESHEIVFHVLQAIGAWLFIIGALRKLELHIVPSPGRQEERATASRKLEEQRRVAEAFERRAAREGALARISAQALTESDPDALLAAAAATVAETLGVPATAGPAVAAVQAEDDGAARVSLDGLAVAPRSIAVRLPAGRELRPIEQKFLDAVGNVLTGALRRRAVEDEMRHQSLHDPLTGLPNRVLLLDRLEHALSRGGRAGGPVSVLFIDLDGFKQVNDRLGHYAGDELLVSASRRLGAVSRPDDTLARMSGDEFVIVCEDTGRADAVVIAERAVRELTRPFELEMGSAAVTASVGVASGVGGERSAEDLLHDADAAMYQAKQRGRGRVEAFDDALSARLSRLNQTEHDLRGAHERGELALVYQPIVDLAANGCRVVGAEALLRWHHPRSGLVLPGEFVELAETRGLIAALGGWVIGEACRQAATWRSLSGSAVPFFVAINVSARQLVEPDFAARFDAAVADSGARHEDLVVELTETAVVTEGPSGVQLQQTLHALRELGVRVALDDFGTGYSSLTQLRTLPLDIVKVDSSFVAGVGTGSREHAIVSALAGLSQELGMNILAEGIERPEQLAAVRRLNFDLAQGYHLGVPGPAEHLLSHLGGTPRRHRLGAV